MPGYSRLSEDAAAPPDATPASSTSSAPADSLASPEAAFGDLIPGSTTARLSQPAAAEPAPSDIGSADGSTSEGHNNLLLSFETE